MEFTTEHEAELRRVLRDHPIGIGQDALFDKVTLFPDRIDLARAIHLAKNQGWIFNKGKLLFLVPDPGKAGEDDLHGLPDTTCAAQPDAPVEPAAPEESARPLSPVAQIMVDVATKRQDANKPAFGSLTRSRALGGAALALFKFRVDQPLSLDDLTEIVGVSKTSLYSTMTKLVLAGYANKCDEDFRRPLFKWSGKYSYPFESLKASDDTLLKFATAKAYHEFKNPPLHVAVKASEPTTLVSVADPEGFDTVPAPSALVPKAPIDFQNAFVEQSAEATSAAVRQIDLELSNHRRQIEVLTNLRRMLAP